MVVSRDLVRTLDRPEGLFVGTPTALRAMTRRDPRVLRSNPQLGPDGREIVYVRLARRGELVLPGEPARHRLVGVLAVAAGTAVGVVLVAVLVLAALTWVTAHWVAIAGSLLIAIVAVYGVGAVVTRCPGLHCVGCRHR